MTFEDKLEHLKRIIKNPLRTLEEVEKILSRLEDSCEADEVNSTVTSLIDLCEQALSEIDCISSQIQTIQINWGLASPQYHPKHYLQKLSIKSVTDWGKWQRGLQDKLSPQENYDEDLNHLLNTWKGDNWGYFIEQQLSFERWHLEGKMWNREDIDSRHLPEVITRPKEPRPENEIAYDKKMLQITNTLGKAEYDAVKKKEYLEPSLAKEVAEFKLRSSSHRATQAKIQAEDLAIESAKQGKPSRIVYYFYQKPSDKKVNSILKLYQATCKRHAGSRVQVLFLFAED